MNKQLAPPTGRNSFDLMSTDVRFPTNPSCGNSTSSTITRPSDAISFSCPSSSEVLKPSSNLPSSLIVRLPDSVAYCSLLADTCTFNRGLIQRRTNRLPFLDLATQTSQKPAPWLYRTQCERLEGFLNNGTHVVLRYLRHRWRLSNQPASRKRKLAAQRLWVTLQNAITALGISDELLPLIIKRAYTIAGLPIPSNLLNALDASEQKLPAPSCCPLPSSAFHSNDSPSASTAIGSMFLGQQPPSALKKVDLCVVGSGADEDRDDGFVYEFHDMLTGQKIVSNRSVDIPTPVLSGEESLASSDANSAKRIPGLTEDSDQKPDDDPSLLSSVGLRVTARHRFEINGHTGRSHKLYNSEAEEEMMEDESDDAEDDEYGTDSNDMDDAEWFRCRGRKRRGVVGNGRSFRINRRHPGLSGRRTTRAVSGFVARFATQRMTKRQRKQKTRRGSCLSESRLSRSSHGLMTCGSVVADHNSIPSHLFAGCDKERSLKEEWDEFDCPGFQPNANLDLLSQKQDPSNVAPLSHPDQLGPCPSSAVGHPATFTTPVIQSFLDNSNINMTHALRPLPATGLSSSSSTWFDTKHLPTETANHNSANTLPTRSTYIQSMSSGLVASSSVTTAPTTSNPPYDYHSMMVANEHERPDSMHIMPTPSRMTVSATAPNLVSPATKDASANNVTYAAGPGRPPTIHAGNTTLDKSNPQGGATTTVTFFVCEVCSSRYRSTAGLRYHYHSQHSGYTPKNPISASASRQVVPIGEERGIGGGLRGGRPRRHKGDTPAKQQKPREMDNQSLVPHSGRPSPSGTAVCGPPPQPILFDSTADAYYSLNENGVTLLNNPTTETSMHNHTEDSTAAYSRYLPELPPDLTISSSAATKLTPLQNSDASPAANGSNSLASMGLMASSLTQPSVNVGNGPTEFHRGVIASQFDLPGKLPPGLDRRFPMHHSPNGPYQHAYISNPMGCMSSQEAQYHTTSPSHSFVSYRSTSQQRRLDRQHCYDRMNLSRSLASTTTGPVCIYCMGDDRMNRQFSRPEGLLRCSTCKYWAHFSCLRLPPHVVETTIRYHWQCIECKTCWLCGTPAHSDRMVLCADCDRAFHVYCLPTPLVRVLDSNWSCDICLHERYSSAISSTSKSDGDKFQTNVTPNDPNDSDQSNLHNVHT